MLHYSPLELSFLPNMIQYLFNYGSLQEEGPARPSLHARFNAWGDDISCALCSVKEQYMHLNCCGPHAEPSHICLLLSPLPGKPG